MRQGERTCGKVGVGLTWRLCARRWNRRADSFSYYGLNSEVALVAESDKQEGVEREEAGFSVNPDLTPAPQ